jgi:hypothetical protein
VLAPCFFCVLTRAVFSQYHLLTLRRCYFTYNGNGNLNFIINIVPLSFFVDYARGGSLGHGERHSPKTARFWKVSWGAPRMEGQGVLCMLFVLVQAFSIPCLAFTCLVSTGTKTLPHPWCIHDYLVQVLLVQIAVPSRTDVSEYQKLRYVFLGNYKSQFLQEAC